MCFLKYNVLVLLMLIIIVIILYTVYNNLYIIYIYRIRLNPYVIYVIFTDIHMSEGKAHNNIPVNHYCNHAFLHKRVVRAAYLYYININTHESIIITRLS